MIRCYQCKFYKPIGKGYSYSGWCQDAKPKIRVQAVDYCSKAKVEEKQK